MAKPPTRIDVVRNLRKLGTNQRITSSMLPNITFEPTIGITAARLDKLGMDIRSFHEPLKRSVQQVVAPSIQKNIDAGGRPTAWQEMSPETPEIQARIRGQGTHPLLNMTGRMRRTIGQLNIWTITRTSAVLADVPPRIDYAKVQQAGYAGSGQGVRIGTSGRNFKKIVRSARAAARHGDTQRSNPPIPARPFVMLQEEDIKEIGRVFDKWFGERIDRAWPK